MNWKTLVERLLLLLLAAALLLPIVAIVLGGLGHLLTKMGDTGGGTVLGGLALAAVILWLLDLVFLLLAQAIHRLLPEE